MAEVQRIPSQRPQLRRLEKPWPLLFVSVVLVAMLVAAFAFGRLVEQPSRDAILAAQEPIPITAAVEIRAVDSAVTFSGAVRGGEVADLNPPDISNPVVVRQTLAVDSAVSAGTLLGVVSGVPIFALPAPLPLYRDLGLGDKGDDVAALQHGLTLAGANVAASGVVDRKTIDAVRALYSSAGIDFPRGSQVPRASFIAIPGGSAVVTAAAAVGTHLDDTNPLASLRVSPPFVMARIDAVAGGTLVPGDVVTIRTSGISFDGEIGLIGAFSGGEEGEIPGYDAQIWSDDPALAELREGTPVTVVAGGAPNEESLAVPVSALRVDDRGDFVERRVGPAVDAVFERVAVSILRTGGGWAAITSSELVPGNQVRVS